MSPPDYRILIVILSFSSLLVMSKVYEKLLAWAFALSARKINKAVEGQVILHGTIKKLGSSLQAPLSNEYCIGYRYVVEDKTDLNKIVHQEEKIVDFILDDESGQCLVHSQAVGVFHNNSAWPPVIRFGNTVTPDNLSDDPTGKRYRHYVYKRQEGESVYIEGEYQRDKDAPMGSVRAKGKTPLIITPAYQGYAISDGSSFNWLYWLRKVISFIWPY